MNRNGIKGILIGFLVAANAALSYGHFPSDVLGWIFALGFLIPIIFLFFENLLDPGAGSEKNGEPQDRDAHRWVFFLVLLGAIPRFWRITETFLWPTGDEGLHGFLALELARHWTGQFFFTVGEHPPLLIWSLALLFKAGLDSFMALWSLPAFFSLLLVPVGYGAARRWFDRRWSLVFVFLMSLSYWPLSLGRYCHQGLFIPFWELSAIWGMGKLFENPGSRWSGWRTFVLGLWIGLGTLTFTAWWAVLFGFTVAFILLFRGEKSAKWKGYGIGLSFGVAPFLFAAFREGYGHHLLDSSFLNQTFNPDHVWITRVSYITSIFWGSLQPGTSYGPLWGGMLNPVLTTAFWVGLVVLFRHWSKGWSKLLLFALITSLLPGVLAGDYVELNRIIQAMPWILMICVVGIRAVLLGRHWEKNTRTGILLVLVLSAVLDGWHYLQPILPVEKTKSEKGTTSPDGRDENYQAYQILKGKFENEGPGIILTDFMPLKYGHTLFVTVHPFNAAANDRIDPRTCKWAALVTNVHFVPFLRTRFPQAQWSWFGTGRPPLDGGMALGILPLGEQDQKWISDWIAIHHSFHQLNLEAERSFNGPRYFQAALKDTWDLYPHIRGDRYLESVYWEWVSQFNFGPDPQIQVRVLSNAVERGYPAAHLLEQKSRWLARWGKDDESILVHKKALMALRTVQETIP